MEPRILDGAFWGRIFAPLALGYVLSWYFRAVNATLAPYIIAEFGVAAEELGTLTAAYFLAFGLMQIPGGIALDRYGARRVQSILLLAAALGAAITASAQNVTALTAGRALLGAGVSLALIAGLATVNRFMPPARVAGAYGLFTATGAVGAALSGAPTEFIARTLGWREVFWISCAFTLVAAALVNRLMPTEVKSRETSLLATIRGLGALWRARDFWLTVPFAVFTCGAAFALQGLWAGRWLTDVAGMDRHSVSVTLTGMALAMLAGSLACGPLVALGRRLGLPLRALTAALAVPFVAALALSAYGVTGVAVPLWLVVGFLMNPLSLCYVELTQRYENRMASRANTGINVATILGSFAIQTAVGSVIGLWPPSPEGRYPAEAYGAALAILALLATLAAARYAFADR